ncbi:hypothetical protein [Bifidobacterium sp. UBA4282]|uniref:hypothetical protein n=1 Tax=Bifidobacterium sp. UBA4282 TaxID=1946096 RepID=UPI0025C24F99|nr:hypothetical protein [Bifidobacterium sp. UBA4282]
MEEIEADMRRIAYCLSGLATGLRATQEAVDRMTVMALVIRMQIRGLGAAPNASVSPAVVPLVLEGGM